MNELKIKQLQDYITYCRRQLSSTKENLRFIKNIDPLLIDRILIIIDNYSDSDIEDTEDIIEELEYSIKKGEDLIKKYIKKIEEEKNRKICPTCGNRYE